MDRSVCATCKNNLCIKKVEVFDSLTNEDMLEILKMIQHKSYKKGEFLCHEGDFLETLFIVNSGKVKLSKFNKDGKEQILNIINDGGIFGEFYLFTEDEPSNFSAVAVSNVKICALSKNDMDYILTKHPTMSKKILVEISKKLIRTENLVQNLSNVNTDSKIAFVLLELSDKYGINSDHEIKIELPITREEMANYAGVTRETMSRKLHQLENEGIIETIGNKIIIIKEIETIENFI